jgi:hypothetical protein
VFHFKIDTMRNLIIIIFFSLLTCCHFTLDTSIKRTMSIHNSTNDAIYVYYTYNDKLQLSPKLYVFLYLPERAPDEEGLDPYCSPDYRINPHSSSTIAEKLAEEKKWIPFPDHPEIDYVNFFFIKESIMKTYKWEEIVAKQMYVKKIKYTYSELEKMNYEISYKP